jgi:uncharacterized protein
MPTHAPKIHIPERKLKIVKHITPSQDSQWCGTSKSSIAGKGLFAIRDIPTSTPIIRYAGRLIRKEIALERLEDGNDMLMEVSDYYDVDAKEGGNNSRFLNHSCSPNCESQIEGMKILIYSTRKIREGRELTINYNYPFCEETADNPCYCDAKNCLGYVIGQEERPKLLRALRRGWPDKKPFMSLLKSRLESLF